MDNAVKTKSVDSGTLRLWIAGDYDTARDIVRKFCFTSGACYSVQKCDYIYTGGEESGVVVTAIHYPRFPEDFARRYKKFKRLADALRVGLCQHSYSIETPTDTVWHSWRPDLGQQAGPPGGVTRWILAAAVLVVCVVIVWGLA